jgi:UDP-N-acetyl-D-galactosamine dehydrogenase
MVGYIPQVILAGRRINDSMAKFVAEQTIKHIIKADINVRGARVNVLGLAFKENCPDLRNSKVADLINELESYGIEIHVHDPVASSEEARHEYGVELESWENLPCADAMIVAVAHRQFTEMPLTHFQSKITDKGCFIDVKSQFDSAALREAGLNVWRL